MITSTSHYLTTPSRYHYPSYFKISVYHYLHFVLNTINLSALHSYYFQWSKFHPGTVLPANFFQHHRLVGKKSHSQLSSCFLIRPYTTKGHSIVFSLFLNVRKHKIPKSLSPLFLNHPPIHHSHFQLMISSTV